MAVTLVCPGYIATGHSSNAVGAAYPEGHTSKGVPAAELAPQILQAVAAGRQELVPAAWDARAAAWLRCLCPALLFRIMRRRARKEALQRRGAR